MKATGSDRPFLRHSYQGMVYDYRSSPALVQTGWITGERLSLHGSRSNSRQTALRSRLGRNTTVGQQQQCRWCLMYNISNRFVSCPWYCSGKSFLWTRPGSLAESSQALKLHALHDAFDQGDRTGLRGVLGSVNYC